MAEAFIKINPSDNVAVALQNLSAGVAVAGVLLVNDVPALHKFALSDIKKGETIIKYGHAIGSAEKDIAKGEWVHTHNLKSAAQKDAFISVPDFSVKTQAVNPKENPPTFKGYLRADGKAGVRNDIWIVPTVGCVNGFCRDLAAKFAGKDVFAFLHEAGCSQCGADGENTEKLLAGLVKHPNAGGVLIVSLGCENNVPEKFFKLAKRQDGRVRLLVLQSSLQEMKEGVKLVKQLIALRKKDKRQDIPITKLTIGLKCGGSDAMSGLTANPLAGKVCDKLAGAGGGAVMGEVPEMFGAEEVLGRQCSSKDVYEKFIRMMRFFKEYFDFYKAPYGENPSPGNREGGITTIEEKSLGCVLKAGSGPVVDVIEYGKTVQKNGGVTLLYTPGNDIASVSALAAAGAQIILFTTGRGTPLGSPVPVIKIASNSRLASAKPRWIDFDAEAAVKESGFDAAAAELLNLIFSVAEGKKTFSEQNGFHDFAIWKNGITL